MIEVKGSIIVETIDAIKQKFGDEVYNKILNNLDENDKKIFGKIVLEVGWYNLDSFAKLLEQDVLVTLNGDEKELIVRSEGVFERQLKGIYRFFIKLGSAEFVIKNLSLVHKTYFRGVSIDVKMESPNKALVRYTGFEKQHRIIGFSIIGFFKKALEMSGARDVNPYYTTPIEENKGYCDLAITWTGK
jgi:hypothetical protein